MRIVRPWKRGLAAVAIYAATHAEPVRAAPPACSLSSRVLVGDVIIDTQADADEIACVEHLVGRLFVTDATGRVVGADESISLPNLRSVTGEVDIVLSSSYHTSTCVLGTGPDSCSIRRVRLPSLNTVRGRIHIASPGRNGDFYAADVDYGFESLTTLWGDLILENESFNPNASGFGALTNVHGSVTLAIGNNDVYVPQLLPRLRSIAGHLLVLRTGRFMNGLPALETVGGNLTIEYHSLDVGGWLTLPRLKTVQGDLSLRGTRANCGRETRVLPALEQVGKTLRLLRLPGDDSFARQPDGCSLGKVGATAQKLVIQDTQLADLTPFAGIHPISSVSITGNAKLCTPELDDFLAELASGGFSGTLTRAGNGTDPSCP